MFTYNNKIIRLFNKLTNNGFKVIVNTYYSFEKQATLITDWDIFKVENDNIIPVLSSRDEAGHKKCKRKDLVEWAKSI